MLHHLCGLGHDLDDLFSSSFSSLLRGHRPCAPHQPAVEIIALPWGSAGDAWEESWCVTRHGPASHMNKTLQVTAQESHVASTQDFSCVQGRAKHSKAHGRSPEELLGMDLPLTSSKPLGFGGDLEESGAATCEIQLSPEETKTLLEMPVRSPGELTQMDLPLTSSKPLA